MSNQVRVYAVTYHHAACDVQGCHFAESHASRRDALAAAREHRRVEHCGEVAIVTGNDKVIAPARRR